MRGGDAPREIRDHRSFVVGAKEEDKEQPQGQAKPEACQCGRLNEDLTPVVRSEAKHRADRLEYQDSSQKDVSVTEEFNAPGHGIANHDRDDHGRHQ